MDVSHLLDALNPAQREAVSAPPGHYLVLAGAGSGKTRVLTHRIGWLNEVVGVPAHGILAVTFTNKAAAEMRGRVESLLRHGTRGMWVGSFHGIAHRLLRMHWQEAGRPESCQVLEAGGRDGEAARAYEDGIAAATRTNDMHARSELSQALDAIRARGA